MKQRLHLIFSLLLACYTLAGTIGVTEFQHICGPNKSVSFFQQPAGCCGPEPEVSDSCCKPDCCHISQKHWTAAFDFFQNQKPFSFALFFESAEPVFPAPFFGKPQDETYGYSDSSPPDPLSGRRLLISVCTYLI
ncbi:MAG: hypothetical protein MI784_16710 [Cytophagales bacterium]|nr:hypothetical protein [Cytophagales bacterium]